MPVDPERARLTADVVRLRAELKAARERLAEHRKTTCPGCGKQRAVVGSGRIIHHEAPGGGTCTGSHRVVV